MKRILPPLLLIIAVVVWLLLSALHTKGNSNVQQAYGAHYDPNTHLLQEIRDEMRGLRADLLSLQPSGKSNLSGEALIVKRCASCHGDKADERGNGFLIVVNGKTGALSVNDRRRIIGKVSRGEMPPTGGLPTGERKVIQEFLSPIPIKQTK